MQSLTLNPVFDGGKEWNDDVDELFG